MVTNLACRKNSFPSIRGGRAKKFRSQKRLDTTETKLCNQLKGDKILHFSKLYQIVLLITGSCLAVLNLKTLITERGDVEKWKIKNNWITTDQHLVH